MSATTHDPVSEVATDSLLAVLRFVDHDDRLAFPTIDLPRFRFFGGSAASDEESEAVVGLGGHLKPEEEDRWTDVLLHYQNTLGWPCGVGPSDVADPGLEVAEQAIRSARILMQYAGALAGSVRPQQGPSYRLISLSKASPTQVVLELAPYAAVPLTVGLLSIVGKLLPVAEKIATFKARTNAVNKTAEMQAALAQAAIDEIHQGKVDALAHVARQERLAMPGEIDILDPKADDSAQLVDLLTE